MAITNVIVMIGARLGNHIIVRSVGFFGAIPPVVVRAGSVGTVKLVLTVLVTEGNGGFGDEI